MRLMYVRATLGKWLQPIYYFVAQWREGDRCLAPDRKDGTLREAVIQRLTSSTAWVVFTNHDEDADEEDEEEEAIPFSKLSKPALNEFAQEKPLFPNSVTDPRLAVPLELDDIKRDRVPYTINRYLRDYQRDGIRFIYSSYICSKGCILGDDMGLGKTVQVQSKLTAKLFSELLKVCIIYMVFPRVILSRSLVSLLQCCTKQAHGRM